LQFLSHKLSIFYGIKIFQKTGIWRTHIELEAHILGYTGRMYTKRTIVLGASPNPERYSYKAVVDLDAKDHEVFA